MKLFPIVLLLTLALACCEQSNDDAQKRSSCGPCGNGVVDCGESCDDGNDATERCADSAVREKVCGNNCRWTFCRLPICGDEVVEGNEQCDDGIATRVCSDHCKLTECGKQADLTAFADDKDCDKHPDDADNCPDAYNPDQADEDSDGVGDACAAPSGECKDGLCGTPATSGCGCGGSGDAMDPGYYDDEDKDAIEDDFDNCPFEPNPKQTDTDGDGVGDACDPEDCPRDCQK